MTGLRRQRRAIRLGKILRQRQTPSEGRLWGILRDRRFHTLKFRRQASVGPFIADFLCSEIGLVVELDGEIHAFRKARDQRRDDFLRSHGYTVLRFSNSRLKTDYHAVRNQILLCARRLLAKKYHGTLTLPSPFDGKGEGENSVESSYPDIEPQ